jgi:hypothetical protein
MRGRCGFFNRWTLGMNQNDPEKNSAVDFDATNPPAMRDLIGLDETAVKLDVCKKTVERLIEDGELGPKVKVRGCAKLFVKNVNAYLDKIKMLAERKYQPRKYQPV